MVIGSSKLSAEGLIDIPEEVRQKLGVGPGSVLEWEEDGDRVVVRKKKPTTFEDIHRAAFPEGPPEPRTLEELKEGPALYVREQHARGRY